MKKELLLIFVFFFSLSVQGENVIQVEPITTTSGITADDAQCISFVMTNTEGIVGIEFKVKLPEGMNFDESDLEEYPPFEIVEDRYPKSGRPKKIEHSVDFAKKQDGWWHVTIASTKLNPIEAGDGVILKGYYVTDVTMSPGVYAIQIKETKLAISGTLKAETPDVATSFVTILDGESSPLETFSNLDLSTMTGYVPSFVVKQLNDDLAANENIAIVNLSGATELGAELVTPDNVVSVVGTTGTLKREFTATYWSTVCLPFALNATQVAALNDEGVEIEEFTDFDETAGTVTFEPVTTMEANTPYIVKSQTTQSPFTNLTNVNLSTAEMNNVVVGKMAFIGTFEKQTLNSSTNTTFYAYNASNGNFVRIGSNATVPPFRAYLKLDNSAGARSFIVNHGDGEATGISTQQQGCSKTGVRYNLLGIPQAENSNVKGIHIQNGQKIVVR